ncbi:hypothetical protein ACS0TY_019972 [Phlomoides rotata]
MNFADEYFMGFKGEDDEFKSKDGVINDTKGVLALYEASHLSMEGEDILHEAAVFSSQHLNAYLISLEDAEHAVMVKNFLQNPQHKMLVRFTPENIPHFLDVGNTWRNLVEKLAFFESALLEPIHKHEILQVVKWWKDLGLSNEMKSSRDQPQKWHMWSMAVLRDPTWSRHRILLSKPNSLVYAVDDIFDLHGTIPQLTLFTQVINRWDICGVEELPNYMRMCFMAIQDTTDEISRMVSQEFGWEPAEILRNEWRNLFNAFLKEAKWFTSGELPNTKEYLENGVISSGVPMSSNIQFWSEIFKSTGNRHDEEQEGYDGSYVECYMKEEKVDSLEAAREHVMGMVSNTWEKLNKHALSSTTPFSVSFREACLNAERMVPAIYNYDNNHRLPLLEQHVKTMFQDTTFTKSILG